MDKLDQILKEIRSLRREVNQLKEEMTLSIVTDEFLSVKEACEALKISSSKLYQMLKNYELPFATRVGKHWKFSRKAIIKYLGHT